MKKTLCIGIVLAASLSGAGCEDDSSGLYRADSIYVDENTGIAWQALGPERNFLMGWKEAGSHCENLAIGGEAHWRLPNADELMTLFRGCDQAECGLDDPGCLTESCAADCTPCSEQSGESRYPCYLEARVGGDCGVYWSSSPDGDGGNRAWAVDFETGGFRLSDIGSVWYVRCVRDDRSSDNPDSGL
jgi:hypothetical protein